MTALLLFLGPSGARAAPDFSRSEITLAPLPLRENDIAVYSIVLRNSGPDDAGAADLMVEWPRTGFLAGARGFDDAQVDHASRRLHARLPLAAGAERAFEVRILAPRESSGDAFTLAIRAAHYDSGTEHWDRKTASVDPRPRSGGAVAGGMRLTEAGMVTLAILLGCLALWGSLWALTAWATQRARRAGRDAASAHWLGPGSVSLVVTVAIGFWSVFGAMAWRDYRALAVWKATTCTVLGGRLSAQTTTRSQPGATSRHIDDTSYVPVLGLRYRDGERIVHSSGYDTGSALRRGARAGGEEEIARWVVGSETPCWYDPADPSDVVVVRGFGGAYLFALLPLPFFIFGARRIVSAFRH